VGGQGIGFRVEAVAARRVQGAGCRVQGAGCRVQGFRTEVARCAASGGVRSCLRRESGREGESVRERVGGRERVRERESAEGV